MPSACHLLDSSPAIEEVPAPELDADAIALVGAVRRRIHQTPGAFDGPQWVVTDIEPGRVCCYRGTYALLEAIPDAPGVGLCALGVRLILTDAEGRAVWMRRSGSVRWPGAWALGVAGYLDIGLSPREAALHELNEELGVGPEQLEWLWPVAMLHGGELDAVNITYAARLMPGVRLRANEEVGAIELRSPSGPMPEPVWFDSRVAVDLLSNDPRTGLVSPTP